MRSYHKERLRAKAKTIEKHLAIQRADLTRAEEIRVERVINAAANLREELDREEDSDEPANDGRVSWSDCE